MSTLTTMLQTLATNPMILNDPRAKVLWNKILLRTNTVSPAELAEMPQTRPIAPNGGGSSNGELSVN